MTIKKVRLERKDMVGYDDIHSQCFKDTVGAYQKVRQDGEFVKWFENEFFGGPLNVTDNEPNIE